MLVEVRATWEPGLILHCLKLAHKSQASVGSCFCTRISDMCCHVCLPCGFWELVRSSYLHIVLSHLPSSLTSDFRTVTDTYSGFVRVVGMKVV